MGTVYLGMAKARRLVPWGQHQQKARLSGVFEPFAHVAESPTQTAAEN